MKDATCQRCGRKFISLNHGRTICVRCKMQAEADTHLAVMAFAKTLGDEYRRKESKPCAS